LFLIVYIYFSGIYGGELIEFIEMDAKLPFLKIFESLSKESDIF
jgi:hypothetical protein